MPGSMVLDADTVRTVLGMMQGPRISDDAWIHDVLIEDTDEGFDITIAVGTEEKPGVPIAEAKQDVYTRLGARPDAVVRVAMDQPSTRKILARTAEVPGYGWTRLRAGAAGPPGRGRARPDGAVVLTNGLVRGGRRPGRRAPSRWTARPATAGWWTAATSATRTTTPRHGRTRSWTPRSPSPSGSTSAGPSGRACASRATYEWPDHVDGSSQARVGGHQVDVDTDVEVRADDATVRVVTTFREPERRPPPARPPAAPRAGTALARRERLRRRHPGAHGRRPARRVRAPHRSGQPLRHAPDG